MGIARVQATIDHNSHLPEDVVVNTWYFNLAVNGTHLGATEAHNMTNAVQTFYTAVDGFLSRELAGTGRLKVYDLSDPEPRVPIVNDPLVLSVPATDNALPEEVALCLSYAAVPQSGTIAARRRGRVFLGPINGSANTSDGRPTTALLNACQAAANALLADALTQWAVYSPTDIPTPDVNSVGPPVQNGWIDNAFDTQRRRGQAPTTRVTFNI